MYHVIGNFIRIHVNVLEDAKGISLVLFVNKTMEG